MDKALHQFDIWQMNANTTNAIKYILVCLAQPFCKVGMDGVGGMGGSPSIRRRTRHLMPGILDRMACGVALALAIGGPARGADPPPRGKKPALF